MRPSLRWQTCKKSHNFPDQYFHGEKIPQKSELIKIATNCDQSVCLLILKFTIMHQPTKTTKLLMSWGKENDTHFSHSKAITIK